MNKAKTQVHIGEKLILAFGGASNVEIQNNLKLGINLMHECTVVGINQKHCYFRVRFDFPNKNSIYEYFKIPVLPWEYANG